jgi:hypothetical protein
MTRAGRGEVTGQDSNKHLSAANFQKLNELAAAEKCSVDEIVSKLIRHYKSMK